MDSILRPIIPPAPKVHARDISTLRLLWDIRRSTIGIWSERAFDELVIMDRALGIDTMLLSDPEGIRHVFMANAANYARPATFFRITRPVTGDGLLITEGADWKRQRRALAPIFTPSAVGGLLPHFRAAGESMVGRLEHDSRANLSKTFHETALDAVLRALFSLPVSEDRASFAAMVRHYTQKLARPSPFDAVARTETAFLFSMAARLRFAAGREAAVGSLIAERRKSGAASQADLLNLLLGLRDPETGAALSDAEIGAQCSTMLFAGFETTSRLLFWATYLLALDTAEQTRLREEVRAFPPERVSTLDDLNHWPRLRQTLLEALRLYPPVPNLPREAIADDEIAGVKLAAGTQVWISPWVIHRHRKLWDNPTAFIPDRFAGKNWSNLPAFLPFGGGPRICIGAAFSMAEAQMVLAMLLERFEFTLESERKVMPIATFTTAPDKEPMFRLEPVARAMQKAA
jgi:cytochrome P450